MERADRAVVRKVAHDQSAAALRHFGGRGCVRLIDEIGGVQLLERIQPGTTLSDHDDAAIALCDVAAQLHACGLPDGSWPTIESWGAPFDGDCGPISASLVARAAEAYRHLASSQGERVLLHGDLHPQNVLLDDRRGWLAIDPKGVIGERAYEFGAVLRNLGNAARVDRWSQIIAERTGFDRGRIVSWAFAQAVLAAIWSVEDGDDPGWAIAAAERIRSI